MTRDFEAELRARDNETLHPVKPTQSSGSTEEITAKSPDGVVTAAVSPAGEFRWVEIRDVTSPTAVEVGVVTAVNTALRQALGAGDLADLEAKVDERIAAFDAQLAALDSQLDAITGNLDALERQLDD
ncbi:hypothetical protein [Microlunatus sp. Y2014]|uniref:hypothetical protein n=1 Tax=Microlunatus sp. Y2014 TaxID=3418488 RepID=UPI003DA76CD7